MVRTQQFVSQVHVDINGNIVVNAPDRQAGAEMIASNTPLVSTNAVCIEGTSINEPDRFIPGSMKRRKDCPLPNCKRAKHSTCRKSLLLEAQTIARNNQRRAQFERTPPISRATSLQPGSPGRNPHDESIQSNPSVYGTDFPELPACRDTCANCRFCKCC